MESQDRKRVVVTGLGAITPVGNTAAATWEALVAGRSGIGPVTQFDASALDVRIVGEVKGFSPDPYMEPKAYKRMSRAAQFAVAASKQALADASLAITDENRERAAVVVSTGAGGLCETYAETRALHEHGAAGVNPLYIPIMAPNMASCQVSIQLGITGPSMTGAAACASGVTAFLDAVRLIRAGEAEIAVTGSTESSLNPLALVSMAAMRVVSKRNDAPERASRPFDRDRDGFVYAEGAAVAVLETLEHARARNARIYCEVLGGAQTSDAYHMTIPPPDGAGAVRAMVGALARAGVAREDVDHIVAHGTATRQNDVVETRAIERVFGDHARKLVVSSPKSMVGHLFGGAGAISALAAICSIRDGVIAPTINLDNPDPELTLDYCPLDARRRSVRVAMINGFGFGGQNGVVVFRAAP